jgi:hypothetical protein
MKIEEEDLDKIAMEAFRRMEHPSGFIKVYKSGFRQCEAMINERLTNALKEELNGLSDVEKVAYLKTFGLKPEPTGPTFSEKVQAMGRKKIITELKKDVPKELIITGKSGEA